MKPRYPVLLLDADGTLFDFLRAEREAFAKTFGQLGLPCDDATYRLYSFINDGYWHALSRREVTKTELVIRRFEDLLRELSIKGSPRKINACYVKNLGEGHYLLPGAEDVCRTLSRHCRLIIATNGVASIQRRRLELSSLPPYIDALVASDRAGADKPHPRFYEYLFEQTGLTDKSGVLMVGDLLDADIRGGVNFGLDTCWYNPQKLTAPSDLPVTHVIHTLEELVNIAFSTECAIKNAAK